MVRRSITNIAAVYGVFVQKISIIPNNTKCSVYADMQATFYLLTHKITWLEMVCGLFLYFETISDLPVFFVFLFFTGTRRGGKRATYPN